MALQSNKNAKSFIEKLQMKSLCRLDDKCEEIVYSANQVSLYFYEKSTDQWLRDHLNGTFFLYKTNDFRKYSIIFLNNNVLIDKSSYAINQLSEIELSLNDQFIKLDRGGEFCLCFHFETIANATECFNNISNVSNICKGRTDKFISNITNKETQHQFSLNYNNDKINSYYSNDCNNKSNYVNYGGDYQLNYNKNKNYDNYNNKYHHQDKLKSQQQNSDMGWRRKK